MIGNRNYPNKCPLLTVQEIMISKTKTWADFACLVSLAVLKNRGLTSNVLVSFLGSWLSLGFKFNSKKKNHLFLCDKKEISLEKALLSYVNIC